MIKATTLKARGRVIMPDCFIDSAGMKKGTEINVYYGARFEVVVITTKDAKLSSDDEKRIRILTNGHE